MYSKEYNTINELSESMDLSAIYSTGDHYNKSKYSHDFKNENNRVVDNDTVMRDISETLKRIEQKIDKLQRDTDEIMIVRNKLIKILPDIYKDLQEFNNKYIDICTRLSNNT